MRAGRSKMRRSDRFPSSLIAESIPTATPPLLRHLNSLPLPPPSQRKPLHGRRSLDLGRYFRSGRNSSRYRSVLLWATSNLSPICVDVGYEMGQRGPRMESWMSSWRRMASRSIPPRRRSGWGRCTRRRPPRSSRTMGYRWRVKNTLGRSCLCIRKGEALLPRD